MSVYYRPWIGKHYNAGNLYGRKLLLLGESHYSDDGNDTIKFTQQYIEDYPGNFSFWTVVMQNVMGKSRWEIDKEEFWHSVAFYNYIQEPLDGPRYRPTETMWKNSEKPFFEILKELSPTHVLVLGKSLWNNLPNDGGFQASSIYVSAVERDTWLFPTRAGEYALSTWLYHPSTGAGRVLSSNHTIIVNLLSMNNFLDSR